MLAEDLKEKQPSCFVTGTGALVVLLSATACTGLGGGGGTTSVVNNGGGGNTTPTTTTSNSLATDSKSKMCDIYNKRNHEVVTALDKFWKHLSAPDWKWTDPNITEDGDAAAKVLRTAIPVLRTSIGSGLPQDLKTTLTSYIDALDKFATVIEQQGTGAELNPVNQTSIETAHAVDHVCGLS